MMRAMVLGLAVALMALPASAVEIREVRSPGGILAWLVEAPEIPFVALELRFRGGATLDPPGREGAVNLMAGLLEEGAGDLDAQGFAAARDLLAASYSFRAGQETLSVSARFLTENRDASVALLRSALAEPAFDAGAVERVRAQVLAGLAQDAFDPSVRAGEAFARATFGEHAYARPTDGTVETVTALTVADLRAAHQAALARDRVYVAAVGDITAAELGELLDTLLGDLPAEGAPLVGPAAVGLTGGVIVDAFDGPQSVISFGHEGIGPDDPDFFAAFIMSEVIGGGRFGTRLMTEVRERRGLTYGIGAGLAVYDQAALIRGSVGTANATAGETIAVIREVWEGAGAIEAEELEAVKTYLTGAYPLRWDGNANIARILVGLQLQGYPVDYPLKRNSFIEAVTLEDARRVAARVFDPERLTFVVVGQPEGLEGQ